MVKAGLIQDRSYASLKWKDCFIGEEVVKYMVQHGRTSSIRETVQLGQELLTQGKFHYVGRSVDYLLISVFLFDFLPCLSCLSFLFVY